MPFLKWFPRDWLASMDVRALPPSTRALWFDILNLMHLSPKYGYLLKSNGLTYSDADLAGVLNMDVLEVKNSLKILAKCCIYSCDSNGLIYNRRMVRDIELYRKRASAGSKGGKSRQAKTTNGHDLLEHLPEHLPEQSVASGFCNSVFSDSGISERGGLGGKTDDALDDALFQGISYPPQLNTPEFRTAFLEWRTNRRMKGDAMSPLEVRACLEKWAAVGSVRAIAAIRHSMAEGYKGIVEDRNAKKKAEAVEAAKPAPFREDY